MRRSLIYGALKFSKTQTASNDDKSITANFPVSGGGVNNSVYQKLRLVKIIHYIISLVASEHVISYDAAYCNEYSIQSPHTDIPFIKVQKGASQCLKYKGR